jgi:hypothetical protein
VGVAHENRLLDDESSITNFSDIFQSSFHVASVSSRTLDMSSLDIKRESSGDDSTHRVKVDRDVFIRDWGESCYKSGDTSNKNGSNPFGVSLDDLFRSFDEHLHSSGSCEVRKRTLRKKLRSRRRRFVASSQGSSTSSSDKHPSDSTRDFSGSLAVDGDQQIISQYDYLPPGRQMSLRKAISDAYRSFEASTISLSKTIVSSSPIGESRLPRQSQVESITVLFREFRVTSEASTSVTVPREHYSPPASKSASVSSCECMESLRTVEIDGNISLSLRSPMNSASFQDYPRR